MGSTIITIIVSLIIGVIIGKLDTLFTDGMRKDQNEKKLKKLAEENEVLKTRLSERPVERIQEPPAALKVSIEEGPKYIVQLDGAKIEPASMTTDQRARLVNLVVNIRPWIDSKPAAPAVTPAAPAAAAPVPAPTPVTAAPVPPLPLPPTPTKPIAPVIDGEDVPRIDLLRGARSFIESSVIQKPVDTSGMSILRRINDYLQKKLVTSPYANMNISLEEGPYGAVIVVIGASKFDGVDSVPDPAIQSFIRTAIAEWNNQG
jgi:hypothetical protein